MATNRWISGAPPIAQVQSWTFAGTWETDDVVRFTIGNVSVDVTVGSATISTLLDTLVAAWNALSSTVYPQFAEMTAVKSGTTIFRLTGDTAGKPFTVTLTPLEANLGAADAQTIEGAGTATTGTATTACSGPNHWTTAANWTLNVAPVDTDDVVIENSSQDILYGLDPASIDLASLTINPSYTGNIGLPKRNSGGYAEYRTDYLTLTTITSLVVEGGKRVKINSGATACACVVRNTGQSPETGVPACLFKNTHASTALTVLKGSVGVAFFGGETSNLTGGLNIGSIDNVESDADVTLGSGVTNPTITKNGGKLEVNANVTTLTHNAGETTIEAGAVTTLVMTGGTVNYNSTGTLTTATVSGSSLLNFDQDPRTKTVTNPIEVHGEKARVRDKYKVVTTLVLDCNYTEIDINGEPIGTNVRLTRAAPA